MERTASKSAVEESHGSSVKTAERMAQAVGYLIDVASGSGFKGIAARLAIVRSELIHFANDNNYELTCDSKNPASETMVDSFQDEHKQNVEQTTKSVG